MVIHMHTSIPICACDHFDSFPIFSVTFFSENSQTLFMRPKSTACVSVRRCNIWTPEVLSSIGGGEVRECWRILTIQSYGMSANAFSHVYIWVTLVFDGLMLCWLLVLFSSSCIAYTSCSHILTYINTHIPYIMMHTYIFVTVMLLRLCTSAFTYACKMCEFAEITRPFMQSLSFVLCAHI